MAQPLMSVPLAIPNGCFGDTPVTLHLLMTEQQAIYLLEFLTQRIREVHEAEKPGWRRLSNDVVTSLARTLNEEP